MQIRMTGDFSYDVVPGLSRRTLHKGLVLDEPMDVALAAIDAGKAKRWPPVSVAYEPETEPGEPGETSGGDDDSAGSTPATAEPAPAAPAPKPSAAPKKGAKASPAGGEATPAEAVEPGGDDDAGDDQAGEATGA